MSNKKIKQQLDIWAEGEYVDLWTVVHFLAGVLLGFAPFIFPYDFWHIFWAVFVLLVLWEVYEYVRDIHETIWNRIIDILIAVLGFGIAVSVLPVLSTTQAIIAGAVLLAVYIWLNLAGWAAYKRRPKQ